MYYNTHVYANKKILRNHLVYYIITKQFQNLNNNDLF